MSETYSKKFRLRTKPDFYYLKENSSTDSSGIIRAFFVHNNLGYPRLGIAISKKFGNAVKRNRYKRSIREEFRRVRSDLGPIDILITFNFKRFHNTEREKIIGLMRRDLASLFGRYVK